MTDPDRMRPQALILDWGGVLTPSLDVAMTQWATSEGVDFRHFREVMLDWVGSRDGSGGAPATTDAPVAALEEAADSGPAGRSPVHRLERGEISASDFEQELAAALARRGSPVDAAGLLKRMLDGLSSLETNMLALVRRARAAGIRTGLLSNSWGNTYPQELFDGLFDAVVISGEVGMRKPERRIFEYTAGQVGVATTACVLVDDLHQNVAAAVSAGMVGILHRTFDETVVELEALFGVPLG